MQFRRFVKTALVFLLLVPTAVACAPGQSTDPDPREFLLLNAPPGAIPVTVNEESFTIPSNRIAPGRTAFAVTNTGIYDHDFVLIPRDGDRYGMPIVHYHLHAGEGRGVEVTLAPGRYEIACLTVALKDGHATSNMSMGMHIPLEVAP